MYTAWYSPYYSDNWRKCPKFSAVIRMSPFDPCDIRHNLSTSYWHFLFLVMDKNFWQWVQNSGYRFRDNMMSIMAVLTRWTLGKVINSTWYIRFIPFLLTANNVDKTRHKMHISDKENLWIYEIGSTWTARVINCVIRGLVAIWPTRTPVVTAMMIYKRRYLSQPSDCWTMLVPPDFPNSKQTQLDRCIDAISSSHTWFGL